MNLGAISLRIFAGRGSLRNIDVKFWDESPNQKRAGASKVTADSLEQINV